MHWMQVAEAWRRQEAALHTFQRRTDGAMHRLPSQARAEDEMTTDNHGQPDASVRSWRLDKPGVWVCEPWTIARVVVMGAEWFLLTRSGSNEVKCRCASRMAAMQMAKSIEAMENGEVRGASRLAGEASSAEGATSTVVLGTRNGEKNG